MTRRPVVVSLGLLLGILVLGGCSSVSRSSVEAIKLVFHQHRSLKLTATQVNAKPYFQLHATTRTGDAVLILGELEGAREYWYGKGGVMVVLAHGQLVQTAGLGQNLDDVQPPASTPFVKGLQHLTGPVDYVFHADWSPGYRYGVPVHARWVPNGSTTLTILGRTHSVMRIDEYLDAPLAQFHAVNQYWVSPRDGFVWKSIQQVAPGLAITLVELRPYRGKGS